MRRIIFSIFMLIGLIMGVPQAQAQTPPVSYTHLDVYKRQK